LAKFRKTCSEFGFQDKNNGFPNFFAKGKMRLLGGGEENFPCFVCNCLEWGSGCPVLRLTLIANTVFELILNVTVRILFIAKKIEK
jgi:hypothetical protein